MMGLFHPLATLSNSSLNAAPFFLLVIDGNKRRPNDNFGFYLYNACKELEGKKNQPNLESPLIKMLWDVMADFAI